jgi:cell wall-associated NlpC family hydrolase
MSKASEAETIRQMTTFAHQAIGHEYVWGGIPGTNLEGGWDCSSFCNVVFGFIGGQAIPGFPPHTYNGSVHGPTTYSWLAWQGQGVGSIARDLAAEGDIACWETHMGYIIDNQHMISAENPTDGTQIGVIDGFIPGEQLYILRLATIGPGGITLPGFRLADEGKVDAVIRDIALSSRRLVNAAMVIRNAGRVPGRA